MNRRGFLGWSLAATAAIYVPKYERWYRAPIVSPDEAEGAYEFMLGDAMQFDLPVRYRKTGPLYRPGTEIMTDHAVHGPITASWDHVRFRLANGKRLGRFLVGHQSVSMTTISVHSPATGILRWACQ